MATNFHPRFREKSKKKKARSENWLADAPEQKRLERRRREEKKVLKHVHCNNILASCAGRELHSNKVNALLLVFI